jgi:hypothetical protein
MENQIKLLKQYGVTNYSVDNGKITINGSLDLDSLTSVYKEFLRKNVKQLKVGYNKEGGYCYFDGILARVDKVSEKLSYTIYSTPIEFLK